MLGLVVLAEAAHRRPRFQAGFLMLWPAGPNQVIVLVDVGWWTELALDYSASAAVWMLTCPEAEDRGQFFRQGHAGGCLVHQRCTGRAAMRGLGRLVAVGALNDR